MTDYVSVTSDVPDARTGAIKLHGRAAFEGMHKAGRLAAKTLDMLVPHMVPGIATAEIDRLIYDFIVRAGGVPRHWAIEDIPIRPASRSTMSCATAFRARRR